MLTQLQPLSLIIRRNPRPVHGGGAFGHAFVDEAADGLGVFKDEGGFVAANL